MHWRLVAGLTVLAACASSGQTDAFSQDIFFGRYEFEGSVTGERSVSGTVEVTEGRFSMSTSEGSCTDRISQQRSRDLHLGCPGIRLVLRRAAEGPDEYATVSIPVEESVDKEVCVEYREDTTGRRYCVRTQVQTEIRMISRSGRVVLRRIGG